MQLKHFKKTLIMNNKWATTCKALKGLLDVLSCSKCKKSLHQPQQFLRCGHFSCISCVNNSNSRCNQCDSPTGDKNVIQDETIKKIIQACCLIAQEVGFKQNIENIEVKTDNVPLADQKESNLNIHVNEQEQQELLNNINKRKSGISYNNNEDCKTAKKNKTEPIFRIPKNLEKKNHHGETKLQQECKKGHEENVQKLLDAGANPHVCCFGGWTPLQECADYGYYKIAQMLLSKGVDVNQSGFEGRTALHDAATNNNFEMVKLLLEHGANKNLVDKNNKRPKDYCKDENVKELLTCDIKSDVQFNCNEVKSNINVIKRPKEANKKASSPEKCKSSYEYKERCKRVTRNGNSIKNKEDDVADVREKVDDFVKGNISKEPKCNYKKSNVGKIAYDNDNKVSNLRDSTKNSKNVQNELPNLTEIAEIDEEESPDLMNGNITRPKYDNRNSILEITIDNDDNKVCNSTISYCSNLQKNQFTKTSDIERDFKRHEVNESDTEDDEIKVIDFKPKYNNNIMKENVSTYTTFSQESTDVVSYDTKVSINNKISYDTLQANIDYINTNSVFNNNVQNNMDYSQASIDVVNTCDSQESTNCNDKRNYHSSKYIGPNNIGYSQESIDVINTDGSQETMRFNDNRICQSTKNIPVITINNDSEEIIDIIN